jgi:hypothetical protein
VGGKRKEHASHSDAERLAAEAYVSIRQHTSAYVSMRQRKSSSDAERLAEDARLTSL